MDRNKALIDSVTISKKKTPAEAKACAKLMCNEPYWKKLKVTPKAALEFFSDKTNDVYLVKHNKKQVGFVLVNTKGILTPLVQGIYIDSKLRGKGVASDIIARLEKIYSAKHSDLFMIVPSQDARVAGLYLRLNLNVIGELRDFMVKGHAELLLHKKITQ